ncbi:1881_t:CDS:1 [Diversispora eburnea]|uniref:1881_t:CDS:1 n=1 Tax=Diversispora eburnea TaxID=1213867 RepID=A0A9N9C6T9_9GLOM|nr:1881_t:CDS:1 [Diversispora eburnea]
MTTKISTELLIVILNNVQSTQDLYSSLLVNRIWCKVTIPILWELPFGQEYCTDYKLEKQALSIRTYISCMDTQARNLLIQNGFDLSSSPPQATFDYPSFIHKFIINNFFYLISIYSRKIIGPYSDDNGSRILFREMYRLIIERCIFLDSFKIVMGFPDYFFLKYSDLIVSILKLPGALKVLKNLESFTSTIRYNEQFHPLYESLTLICNNILNMDLELNTNSQVQLLVNLIGVQKRLENLSISAYHIYSLDCNSLLWEIIGQKETLKRLHLYSVSFNQFECKSSPIGQFISLQELCIVNCNGLDKSDSLFFASAFTQLSSFHCFYSSHTNNWYPQKFIIKILETANTNLKNICLDLNSVITLDIFSTILNYCTRITELTLYNLSSEQVITIFNNNFNELRSFSFNCGKEFDANELLCQMAENAPESLEIIEIRMGRFTTDSLRKFVEGWCCKGRGGNKKIIVIRTEQARLFRLSDDHFKVIEKYGVQINIKE